MQRAVTWSISTGLLLIFYLLYSFTAVPSKLQSQVGRRPIIWISLSVCLGNATRLYHKEHFPYGQAALLATLLWRRVTNQEVKVLVTLVHAIGTENLAEQWTKDLKKESQDMDKVLKVEELEMMSNAEVEKVVETSGVLVISAPQNSLGCVLHSQLARVYSARSSFLLDDDILVT